MSSKSKPQEHSDISIRVRNLGKCYHLYGNPRDRLKQFVLPRLRRMMGLAQKQYFREFWSLRDISFEVKKGEVLGIIGKNGAGKSTLLQILCGTLTPTAGTVETNGRVAALLELGAGFNTEFTGRENVYLNASVLGLSTEEIDARFDEIVAFADIGLFIDQPVKTYSSGMFVRLAFSIATSVAPDILIVDEALSVGDGEFSRKSFDRIMALKKAGKTILFCSHSLYQVEAICSRAIWLNNGQIQSIGIPDQQTAKYNSFLSAMASGTGAPPQLADVPVEPAKQLAPKGTARFTKISLGCDSVFGDRINVRSGHSKVEIRCSFVSDPALPVPTVGVGFAGQDGKIVTSAGSHNDGVILRRDADGSGEVSIVFEHFPLLKGEYNLHAALLCESAIHTYEYVGPLGALVVTQDGLEQGIVSIPHSWKQHSGSDEVNQ